MTVQGIPSVSESICKGKGKSVKRKQQTKEAKTVIKAASKTKLHDAVRNTKIEDNAGGEYSYRLCEDTLTG